jgi:hypothetical protein
VQQGSQGPVPLTSQGVFPKHRWFARSLLSGRSISLSDVHRSMLRTIYKTKSQDALVVKAKKAKMVDHYSTGTSAGSISPPTTQAKSPMFVGWVPGSENVPRKTAPRLHHKKSRTGCQQCRARRVKVSFFVISPIFIILVEVFVQADLLLLPSCLHGRAKLVPLMRKHYILMALTIK